MIMIVITFITDLLLNIDSYDEFLFAKILLFIIVLLVVYTVISKNTLFEGKRNKPIQWIVSSSVSILAIRFLPDEFVSAILLQYSTLAVGITIFLPLLIFFFFLHQSSIGPFGRKVGWAIYLASFIAIWSFRYTDLQQANLIYWIGAGFVTISFIFDKRIHKYFSMADYKKFRARHRSKSKRKLMRDLQILDEDLTNGIINQRTYERESREIRESIDELT